MKKLFCIILSLLFVFCFCSCGDTTTEKASEPNAIETAAESGKLGNAKFQLGTSREEIETYVNSYIAENGEDSDFLDINEYGELTSLMTKKDLYFYKTANADKGMGAIVTFDNVGDFSMGITMIDDVKKSLAGEYTESTATEEQQYFLPAAEEDCKLLSYNCGKYRLDFFFISDFLSAITLTDPEIF